MAMRSWVSRGSVTRLMDSANRGAFSRFFSDKGRVLSEEEQAKENVYIQVGTSTFTLFGSGRISRSIFLTLKYYFVFVCRNGRGRGWRNRSNRLRRPRQTRAKMLLLIRYRTRFSSSFRFYEYESFCSWG